MAVARPSWMSEVPVATPVQSIGSRTQGVVTAGGVLPENTTSIAFGFDNLVATATTQAWVLIPGSAAVAMQVDEQVPFSGSVVAIAFRSNAAKTAGVASFAAAIDGTTGASVSWSNGQTRGYQTFGVGQHAFAAGQEVGVRAVTSAFAPTTADVLVRLYLSASPG